MDHSVGESGIRRSKKVKFQKQFPSVLKKAGLLEEDFIHCLAKRKSKPRFLIKRITGFSVFCRLFYTSIRYRKRFCKDKLIVQAVHGIQPVLENGRKGLKEHQAAAPSHCSLHVPLRLPMRLLPGGSGE